MVVERGVGPIVNQKPVKIFPGKFHKVRVCRALSPCCLLHSSIHTSCCLNSFAQVHFCESRQLHIDNNRKI